LKVGPLSPLYYKKLQSYRFLYLLMLLLWCGHSYLQK